MNPSRSTIKKRAANTCVIFTAIWSSVIMPVIPAYAKMLDNKELPSLGSDHITNEDNTERLAAEYGKTLGTFLSQKKTMKDLSNMTQDYARDKVAGEATKEIENWLSKAGKAKLNIAIDKNLSLKNTQLDWLIPWYEHPQSLLFTQHHIHHTDGRLQTNNGVGFRYFMEQSTMGINTFVDYDISQQHTRAGVGVEYWRDYLKFNANSYFALSSWKSVSELNHEFNARPAQGWDVQTEGWLPFYPQLGASVKYEQYYGKGVALFGKHKRQKNPKAATLTAHWTPFPLLTLNASHKQGNNGVAETQAKIQFTWTLGKSLAHHLDPTKVAESRRLMGNRDDFIDRNNNIVLNYQQKTLIRLVLPSHLSGDAEQELQLMKSLTSRYPIKKIVLHAPELLAAGGSMQSTTHAITVKLPAHKMAKTPAESEKINRYRLQATAYDNKGNASSTAETIIQVNGATIANINPKDVKYIGHGLANGIDINTISVTVKNAYGAIVPNAKVTFMLPAALTLSTPKSKTTTPANAGIRRKMQPMKVATPWEHTVTTNSNGEAQMSFTSLIAGTYQIGARVNGNPPIQTQVTLQADAKNARIESLRVLHTQSVADGKSENRVAAYVLDDKNNPVVGFPVKFTSTHAKIAPQGITNEKGEVEMPLTSTTAGVSEVTASTDNDSKTVYLEFIYVNVNKISKIDVTQARPGTESTLTLTLLDAQGNRVSGADGPITVTIGNKPVSVNIHEVDDGVYEGTLPGQLTGDHVVQASLNGIKSPKTMLSVTNPNIIAVNPNGLKGELGVIHKIEIKTGSKANLTSGDNLKITVSISDAFDNDLKGINPDTINLGKLLGNTLSWVDEDNGDYSLHLLLTQLGENDITASIGHISSPKTTLMVNKSTGVHHIENVVITPNNQTPQAGDRTTLTVVLTDSHGNQVKGVKQLDVTIAGTAHTLPITENQDGSYTAELPALQSGHQSIHVSVNGKDSNTQTINVQAPSPISVKPNGKKGGKGVLEKVTLVTASTANLKSGDSLALTVTAQDAFNNPLTGLSSAITLTHQQAGAITWTENQNGSYTASLALNKLGSDALTATINKVDSKTITFNIANLTGHTGVQNVVITPNNRTPQAGDRTTLTVVLTDSHGNQVKGVKQLDVTIAGTVHTLPITENQDGSYTAELPALQSGHQSIHVSVNGKDSNTQTINVQAPSPISVKPNGKKGGKGVLEKVTLVTASTANLKSGDSLALTVTAQDAFNNPLTGLASAITFAHAQTGNVTWKDNQDGTYTASLALTKLGTDTLTATVNTVSSKAISLTVDNAVGNTHIQTVVVTPINSSPNAGDKPTLKIELTDSNGNPVKGVKQLDVTIAGTVHTLPITENQDGSYTAELPALQSGNQSIHVSVNGKDSNTQTINVQAPSPIPVKPNGKKGGKGVLEKVTLVTASTANLKSGDSLALTVTAQDAFNNPLTGLSSAITLTHQQAGAITWTENQNGSYTASLALNKLGSDAIEAKINAINSGSTTLDVNLASGKLAVRTAKLSSSSSHISPGDQVTLTLKLQDINNHAVINVDTKDIVLEHNIVSNHSQTTLLNTWKEVSDGIYQTELPLTQSGQHTLTTTVNNLSDSQSYTVNQPTGVDKVAHIEIYQTSSMKKSTVTPAGLLNFNLILRDQYNNAVTGVEKHYFKIQASQNGKVVGKLRIEREDHNTVGLYYIAPLVNMMTQVGQYEIDINVNGAHTQTVVNIENTSKTIVANFQLRGEDLNAAPLKDSLYVLKGDSQKINITPLDKYGNLIPLDPKEIYTFKKSKNDLLNLQWKKENNGSFSAIYTPEYIQIAHFETISFYTTSYTVPIQFTFLNAKKP